MTNPDDIENIITGAFGLLGLIGVPAAIIAGPVISIVRGVLGLTNSKAERKAEKKRKIQREVELELAEETEA